MKKLFVLTAALFVLGACATNQEATTTDGKDAKATAEKTETKADAAASTATSGSKSSCTLDKDTRVIEVKKQTPVDASFSTLSLVKPSLWHHQVSELNTARK